MAKKSKTAPVDTPLIFDLTLSDTTLSGMVTRRATEAKAHWNKEYDLDKVRQSNRKMYNSEYLKKELRDERYQEIYSDNKIFTAVRTIVPFITSNMTKPEIIPANSDSLSLQFAKDFEKILVEVGEECYGRDKVKLAAQDMLTGQRVAIIKFSYDPNKKRLCIDHLDPDSVVIGKRSRLREEPDFVQHTQERTIGDLVRQFPDKKDQIYKLYEITKGVPSQLERVVKITENWIFVEDEEQLKLGIIWLASENLLLGKMTDPNWVENGSNLLPEHMMPFVFFNFLNDGSGYVDNTSFVEQAQYSQKQYDKRGSTIAENASYAGIGVPIFGKGAIKEETAAKVMFNPVQRILLDQEDVNKSFTTWTAGNLQPFIMEDKLDLKQSVLDVFGTNTIQQGQNSNNKTLGQDVLLRNQAEGRQQELIDCIDNAMLRFYQIEAQMIYRYFDAIQYYNFLGEDGEFEHLAISQARIAKNLGLKIKIKSGSSLPVDRSQKIAQALELAKMGKIGTLKLYKELGVTEPEEAYKEFLREHLLPFGELSLMDKEIFSREADEDLQLVISGKTPDDREDMTQEYLTHIQEYLLTQKYEQLKPEEQARVSQFVAAVIAQAQRKMLKMSMMQPIIQDQGAAMPPVRAKLSLSGKDLQPDVLAQAIQNIGMKPSALTPLEMAAGIMTPPQERIQAAPLPTAGAGPAPPVQP